MLMRSSENTGRSGWTATLAPTPALATGRKPGPGMESWDEYLKPAFFNELLNVSATISELRKASLCFRQAVSNQQKETLCTAEVKIACIHSKTLKPVSIPEFITKELGNDA